MKPSDSHGEADPSTLTTITCPRCASESEERMLENACVVVWECPACGTEVRPKSDDCCVFCSHGSRPCPPEQ